MHRNELSILQGEFDASRRDKMERLHVDWQRVLGEYRFSDWRSVATYVERHMGEELLPETLAAECGRVPRLHLLVRKARALGTLRNPDFQFWSDLPWDDPFAELFGSMFPALQRQVDWDGKMRASSLWAYLLGVGILKVGLSGVYVSGEAAYSEDAPRGAEVPFEGRMPYGASTEWGMPEVKPGDPNLVVVPPYDVFVNPGARCWEHVQRIYHVQTRPLRDVLYDSRLSRSARARLHGDTRYWSMLGDGHDGLDRSSWPSELHWVRQIEVTDLPSGSTAMFVSDLDEPLRDWTPLGLPVENPFIFHTPIPDPQDIWGISYGGLLVGQAQAVNRVRAITLNRIAQHGKKVTFWDSTTSPEEIDAARRAQNGEHVKISNLFGRGDGRLPFIEHESTGISADVLRLGQTFDQDLAYASGLTDMTRGQQAPGDQTATESSIRQQAEGVMMQDMLDQSISCNKRTGVAICKILLAHWGQQRMVRVTGPDGRLLFWVPVERTRLLNDFNMDLVPGSGVELDPQTLRRTLAEMMPRWSELANLDAQQKAALAQGMPAGSIDFGVLLEESMRLVHPSLARRVLGLRKSAELVVRLVQQWGVMPQDVAPELQRMVVQLVQQGHFSGGAPMGGGGEGFGQEGGYGEGATPEERLRMAAPRDGYQGGGAAGFERGRELSEAAGGSGY